MDIFLDYASRGRNAWWRYVASSVAAFLVAGLILILLSMALLATHLLGPRMVAALRHPTEAPAFFLGMTATFGALLAGWVLSARFVQKKRFADIVGLWRWPLFFRGAVIWILVECAAVLADRLLAPGGFRISASAATLRLFVFASLGLGVQTFAEEFVFRGFLTQGLLLALKRPIPAAIASGLLFGALHIPNGAPQAVNAVAFGVACSYIAIRTGGIAFTYGLHLTNNLFGAVVVVSTSDVFKGSPGLITQNTPGLLWWDVAYSVFAFAAIGWFVWRGGLSVAAPRRERVAERAGGV